MYRTILLRNGFDVGEAAEGAQALAAIERRIPDLIVAEYGLPMPDPSRSLAEMLGRDPRTAAIPILTVTAWATPEYIAAAKAEGAVRVIPKPMTPRDLLAVVREIVGQRAADQTCS